MAVEIDAMQPVSGRRGADEAKQCMAGQCVSGLAGVVGDGDLGEMMLTEQGADFGAEAHIDERVGADPVGEVGRHVFA